jgi:hypothetical protein
LAANLGERQEAEGVAITVLSMARTSVAQTMAAYPGPAGQPHDQIALELLVENVARDALLFYAGAAPPEGVSSVRLLDTHGQTYQPEPFSPHHHYQMQRSVLLKGDRLRHTLVYAVPSGTSDLLLRFDPRAHNAGTYPIEVRLGRGTASVPRVPTASTFPPSSPRIGEPHQVGAFAITVVNVERRPHVPDPSPTPAAPTVPYTDDVLVDVLFQNTTMEQQLYEVYPFYLKDQNGYEYVDLLNGPGNLGSRERARVTFVFTVREQADGFRLGMLTPAFGDVVTGQPAADPPVIFFDLQQRSPTAQISPTPSGPTAVLMGERQDANGIGFTAESATRTPRIETRMAAPGNTFVFVSVLLENTGPQAQRALTERFTLTDDAGRTYRSAERGISTQPPFLIADPLLANDYERGGVAFEIPQAAHGVRLSFEPPPIDGSTQPAPALHVDLERRPRTFSVPAHPALTPSVVRGGVGERVEADGIALTVASVQDKDLDPGSLAGTHRITVEVVFENVGSDHIEYGPLSFRLRNQDGYQHLPQPGSSNAPTTLKRSEQIRLQLSFEAWKGSDLTLTYYGDLGASPIWITIE